MNLSVYTNKLEISGTVFRESDHCCRQLLLTAHKKFQWTGSKGTGIIAKRQIRDVFV